MNLTNSQREKINLLVKQAITKTGDRPELTKELQEIVDLMESPEEFKLETSVSQEDMTYVRECIGKMEELFKEYTFHIDINDVTSLERVKKEISVQLMYLSSYKDRLYLEVEKLEDVFKKEIPVKLAYSIKDAEGISYTQAEKKVAGDDRYSELREVITSLKVNMYFIKTKYDFFSKMVQVIVQSISVASKEHYTNRVNN